MQTSTNTPEQASTTKLRRSFVLGIAGLLTVGAVGVGTAFADAQIGSEAASDRKGGDPRLRIATPSMLTASAGNPAGCSFAVGTRMAYAISSETVVEIDFGRLSDTIELGTASAQVATTPAEAHAITRDWKLELEAVALDEDGASLLAARITDHGLRAQGTGETPAASKALADTFLIRVDARCAIREFGWRSEGELDAAREQQVMAAGLGFWAPRERSEAANYGGTSFDASGRYQASFHYDESGRISGQAVSYAVGTGVSRGALIALEVLASTIEVELAPGAWFESLTNERDLELTLNGRAFGTHFRSTKAARTELGRFAPVVNLNDGGWSFGVLAAAPSDPSKSFDEALIELPLDDALASYRELVAAGSVSDYTALMRDWLRANPEGASELLGRLRGGEFEGEQVGRSGLFYALGSANTPQAQTTLLEIIGGGDEIGHQIAAAHALSMVNKPSEAMVELLTDAAGRGDLHEVERGSMALALGAFAKHSEAHDPEVAALARAEIQGWLETPSNNEQLGHSLLAAGNAGHDELVPDIAAYLDHQDPTIRRDATHAMRQMSPEQAFPQLERSLADEDRVVRTSALETATTVARQHGQAPPEAMIEIAAGTLVSAAPAEEHAAMQLLAVAAKRGDSRADEALRGHLREQLDAGDRDPRRLAALGRSMPGQWKAAR